MILCDVQHRVQCNNVGEKFTVVHRERARERGKANGTGNLFKIGSYNWMAVNVYSTVYTVHHSRSSEKRYNTELKEQKKKKIRRESRSKRKIPFHFILIYSWKFVHKQEHKVQVNKHKRWKPFAEQHTNDIASNAVWNLILRCKRSSFAFFYQS